MATNVASTTRFPVLEVAGLPREMGRQTGEAMRSEIRELVDLVLARFNKGRETPISLEHAQGIVEGTIPLAREYAPDSVDELEGIAEAAGVPVGSIMLLNARNMLAASADGCTSVMVSSAASAHGVSMAGQNWDNDPAMDPFSVVLIRRPSGKPSLMNWTQPGIIGYMGLNSEGIGICMNALNGPMRRDGVPWYFIVREIYGQSSLDAATAAVQRARRAIAANAAMVTPQGAADIEVTPDDVRVLLADESGLLVHTNHCVHPDLTNNNSMYADRIYGQSIPRKARAEAMLDTCDGTATLEKVKEILSDHDGYPTSICRHPNDDPATGWQRSVISMIVEPSEGRMHVTRGNPCEKPYEVYTLN